MAEQPPEELHLKHVRAPDYKEISADGTLHKLVDKHLVITFYIDDSRVTGEILKRDGQDTPDRSHRGRKAATGPARGARAHQSDPRACSRGS